MATCRRTPLSPTAMEAAAMTAGPVRNLTAMAKAAVEFPHAMTLGCKAMKRPVTHSYKKKEKSKACPSVSTPPLLQISQSITPFGMNELSSSPPPPPTPHHHKLGKKSYHKKSAHIIINYTVCFLCFFSSYHASS